MRSRNIVFSLLFPVLALVLPAASRARTLMPTLEALTEKAKVIVVARVEEINTEPFENANRASGVSEIRSEKRVATARVLEVWKGAAGEKVQFRASRTWTCDVSTAVMGETVVLFLAENPKDSVMSIAYDGIGRLPVRNNSILLYSNLLTKKIKQLLGLPKETFSQEVELSTFRQQVQQLAEGKNGKVE
jgi:hypothetical protein